MCLSPGTYIFGIILREKNPNREELRGMNGGKGKKGKKEEREEKKGKDRKGKKKGSVVKQWKNILILFTCVI